MKPKSIRCHACSGRFMLAAEQAESWPYVARHTLPYCTAFLSIETSLDAIAFAERCGLRTTPA